MTIVTPHLRPAGVVGRTVPLPRSCLTECQAGPDPVAKFECVHGDAGADCDVCLTVPRKGNPGVAALLGSKREHLVNCNFGGRMGALFYNNLLNHFHWVSRGVALRLHTPWALAVRRLLLLGIGLNSAFIL